VGCTAYLTPPDSQGIAPHHDDVEVFILQTQGSKSWQLFAPQRELSHKYEKTPPGTLGKAMMEVTLEQGDLLYIPRGVIHQAKATADFSTHLTVSTYQAQSYGDLLQAALPAALSRAMDLDVSFRRGLPLRAFHSLGTAAAADTTDSRCRGCTSTKVLAY
jgi:lysine-specific demethylase/histidyl-hydroxylase NO66